MDTICSAISEKRCLSFLYSNKRRLVEPHLLGYDSDGDLTLSAWQLSGGSGTGWRDFHVSKMFALTTDQATFREPRQGYNRFDKSMTRVVCRL